MQFSQRVHQNVKTGPNHNGGSPCGNLFFTSTPPLKELCTVFLSVQPSTMKNGSVNSFQPQVIKCRELIFTEPDMLASPVLGSGGKVQIITQINVFKTGRLQNRFQRMNVQASQPKPVTPKDYQTCLNYTLMARIAPLWNKVGDYLLEGRDFVTSTQKLNAITFNLTVNVTELYLNLSAFQVRIPPITLNDLNICKSIQEEFLSSSNENDKISEYEIHNKWCHILPSMKKGMIVGVLKNLPLDSPFKSYKDVKKYWKNMYGYRLPDTEEGLLFYQIFFKPIGHTLFTYPECCIRLRNISIIHCTNRDEVIQKFLADLHNKMPVLCGQKLCFQTKVMHPMIGLTEAQHKAKQERTKQSNLTQNAIDVRSNDCYIGGRPKPTQERRIVSYEPWKPSGLVNSYNDIGVDSRRNSSIQGQQATSNNNTQVQNNFDKIENENNLQTEKVEECKNVEHKIKEAPKRFVPVFKPKIEATSKQQLAGLKSVCSNQSTKVIPTFKPRFKPTQCVFRQNLSSQKVPETKINSDKDKLNLIPYQIGTTQYISNKNSFDKSGFLNVASTTQVYNASTLSKADGTASINLTSNVHNCRPTFAVPDNARKVPTFEKISTNLCRSEKVAADSTSHERNVSTPKFARNTLNNSTPFNHKRKITDEDTEDSGKSKKPRAKPKIQEGVDVELLAKSNQLGKVNTITLITWLKERGIPCKSKDKKAELVEKVTQSLQLKIAES